MLRLWESYINKNVSFDLKKGKVTLEKAYELSESIMKKSNRNKKNSSKGKGWPERKQLIVTKKGIEDKAPKHHDVAIKKEADNGLNIPMKPAKKRRHIAAGWQETLEGYTYEKGLSPVNTIDIIIKKVLKGSVIANHAIIELYTYRKDVGALTELQDKERTLEAKLSGYVMADPEYPEIAQKLYEVESEIRAIKQDIGAEMETETLLEDWYLGDIGSEEHIDWQEKFMQKALIEAERAQRRALSEPNVNRESQKSSQELMDEISKAARPIKILFEWAFPPATPAIEVVYQIITNTKLKKALNGFLETTAKYVLNSAIQSIKEDKISDIVDISSKYWEDKHAFKDITEKLNLGDSYSDDFRDFYKTSLSNCLNQIYDNVDPIR